MENDELLTKIFDMVQETKKPKKKERKKPNITPEHREELLARLARGREKVAANRKKRKQEKAVKNDGGKPKGTEPVEVEKVKENLELKVETKEIRKDDDTIIKIPIIKEEPRPEPIIVKEEPIIIPKRYLTFSMF